MRTTFYAKLIGGNFFRSKPQNIEVSMSAEPAEVGRASRRQSRPLPPVSKKKKTKKSPRSSPEHDGDSYKFGGSRHSSDDDLVDGTRSTTALMYIDDSDVEDSYDSDYLLEGYQSGDSATGSCTDESIDVEPEEPLVGVNEGKFFFCLSHVLVLTSPLFSYSAR